ncbi:MAG: histidinol dehydrogenase, partial [Kiritimatiellae bacterium]|nr:histidinol dehydrogenase [Kiritimatiellia bacterium]
MIRIVKAGDSRIGEFNARPAFPQEAEDAAFRVLADIRKNGDRAVRKYVAKFEGYKGTDLKVDAGDIKIPAKIAAAVKDAHRRVMKFSKASLRKAWTMKTPGGGSAGEFFSPMDRVGVYVPGGTAPLASTSIMTVTLAKAAGVREIVACTPAGRTGEVNPVLLYALKLAGATEIYRVGGIQAIGMMPYGTESCRKVQKIAGPGNAFVTAAKRQVYGYVAIDQVAGPSEIAVLADGSVDARWVAADLLSQAEHGSGLEKSLCVCTSREFAEKVRAEVLAQTKKLSRREIIERVINSDGILIVVAKDIGEGMEVVNRFAPEHFEIMTKDALKVMKGVRSAGAVFAPVAPGAGESALRRYASERLQKLSDALRELFDTVHGTLEKRSNDNDIASVFDRAADEVCIRCRNRDLCWQCGYADTLDILNGITGVMLSRGRITRGDLPERFRDQCIAPEAFVTALNGELRAMMFRKQFRARLGENRAAAYGQYADMSKIMETAAKELAAAEGTDPLAERRLLRFLHGMDMNAKASVFRDARGRLHATVESGSLGTLTKDTAYLDKLSGVLGVRLCRPAAENDEREKILLLQAEPLAVSVGIAAMKKQGEPVSGDRGTYFKTDSGVLCVILSDGMGSGTGAARDSVAAVRVLERFLRAGVEPVTAMKILNSVMLLRNG